VSPPPASAETLRLATNWGKGLYLIARTLSWVEEFNKSADAKAANINIKYIGGPEVTPAREQLTAVRNGVFYMVQGAAGYYVGVVPEAFAIYGTAITPMEARKNGGLALLNEIYNKKANAEVLGWIAAGVGYHV
jgi:TRAP-type mannitol/chloroaromatic compound transport system substrate-binding protein